MFEAAPLLLIAEGIGAMTRRPRLMPWLAGLIGCGCGALPRALSVPGAILCTLAFGPGAALARWLAGLALALRPGPSGHAAHRSENADALNALGELLPIVLLGALLSHAWSANAAALPRLPDPAQLVAGLALGALLPCDLGAVILAATLRGGAPWLAYGVLGGGTLCDALRQRHAATAQPRPGSAADARLMRGGLALACLLVAARGGNGLVHPRLIPALILGAAFAAARAPGASSAPRAAGWAALTMLAAALSTPAPPPVSASAATLDDLFVTRAVTFTGAIDQRERTTLLVRYAITCCRADAAPLALRLDRRLPQANASWATVDGTIERDTRGFFLHVKSYRSIMPPADPFLYR